MEKMDPADEVRTVLEEYLSRWISGFLKSFTCLHDKWQNIVETNAPQVLDFEKNAILILKSKISMKNSTLFMEYTYATNAIFLPRQSKFVKYFIECTL